MLETSGTLISHQVQPTLTSYTHYNINVSLHSKTEDNHTFVFRFDNIIIVSPRFQLCTTLWGFLGRRQLDHESRRHSVRFDCFLQLKRAQGGHSRGFTNLFLLVDLAYLL